jgi:hypothetical protein
MVSAGHSLLALSALGYGHVVGLAHRAFELCLFIVRVASASLKKGRRYAAIVPCDERTDQGRARRTSLSIRRPTLSHVPRPRCGPLWPGAPQACERRTSPSSMRGSLRCSNRTGGRRGGRSRCRWRANWQNWGQGTTDEIEAIPPSPRPVLGAAVSVAAV